MPKEIRLLVSKSGTPLNQTPFEHYSRGSPPNLKVSDGVLLVFCAAPLELLLQ